jgi:hypothetical protein
LGPGFHFHRFDIWAKVTEPQIKSPKSADSWLPTILKTFGLFCNLAKFFQLKKSFKGLWPLLKELFQILKLVSVQVFDAYHISATCILGHKKWLQSLMKKIILFTPTGHLFGPEIRVAET